MNLYIQNVINEPLTYLPIMILTMFSICLHEFMHAFTALKQGDTTAKEQGHLTLNPLKQMGPISLVMLAIIGIAWGAVPVNPNRMKHKYSNALVAFAGPFTNLVLAFFFATICAIIKISDTNEFVALFQIFGSASVLNLVLFAFNMIPVPPFDGWSVFTYFIPKLKHKLESSEFHKGGALFILIAAVFLINKLFYFFSYVVQNYIDFIVELIK